MKQFFSRFRLAVFSAFLVFCLFSFNSPLSAEETGDGFSSEGISSAAQRVSSGASNSQYTGTATYSIPIVVPPGRTRMAPDISLTYSSMRGNGWLGVGWDIGMGSIQRSLKDGVKYDGSDKFEYSSSELVNTGSEYRLKIDDGSFLRFFYISGKWTAYDKNGKVYYFGTTTDSRQTNGAGTKVFKWMLDRVEDANGNYMTVTYSKDLGQIYIDTIEYTGNTNGLSPNYYVKFLLEDISNTPNMYQPNFKVNTAKRLKTVEVGYVVPGGGGTTEVIRTYEISYVTSPETNRSLISSVQEFEGTGTAALPPVTFDYTQKDIYYALGGTWPQKWTASWWLNGPNYGTQPMGKICTVGDFNGDAKSDLACYTNNAQYWHMALSTGNGWMQDVVWDNGPMATDVSYACRAGDYNGDGMSDIACYTGTGGDWYVALSTGTGDWNGSFWSGGPVNVKPVGKYCTTGDFDGNGKTDLACYSTIGQMWHVALSTGSGWGGGIWYNGPAVGTPISKYCAPGDFSGDGKTDLACYTGNYGLWYLAISTGSEFSPNWWWNGAWAGPDISVLCRPGDFNGDGKSDIACYTGSNGVWHVSLSQGVNEWNSWDSSFWYYGPAPGTPIGDFCLTGDYNKDGKTDINCYSGYGQIWHQALSTGTSWGNSSLWYEGASATIPVTDGCTTGDFTGDGMGDIACYSGSGGAWYVAKSTGPVPDLLKQITNENNGITTIGYTSSSSFSNTRLPIAMPVVSSMAVDDANGNVSTVGYTYYNGYFDIEDKEFRGFGTVKQTNPDGSYINTFFHQRDVIDAYGNYTDDEDFKGKPYHLTSYGSYDGVDNPLVSITELTWDRSTDHGVYPVYVKLKQKDTTGYTGPGSAPVSTNESFVYDDSNGNMLTVQTSGPDAETLTSEMSYHNYGDWLWRNTVSTLSGDVSGIVRKTSFGYDNKGNLISKISHDLVDPPSGPELTFDYYPEGNIANTTDPLGNTTKTYYDDATKTYPVRVEYPITGGTAHVVQFEYDYRFGAVKFAWDENGNKSENVFDDFGRLTEVVSYVGEGPEVAAKAKTLYSNTSDPAAFPRYVKSSALEKKNGDGSEVYMKDNYTYFDGLGREIKTVSYGENNKKIVAQTHYDDMGRAYRVEGPYFEPESGGYPDQYPVVTTTYDAYGNPETVSRADGEHGTITSTVTYKELTTTIIDPDGRKKSEKKDYLGRVIEVKEYLADGSFYTTTYSYDAAGDLLTTIDHLNNVTTLTYDALGRKLTSQDPDMGYWQYSYDLNNNLTSQTDAKGQAISFTYDALNRLKTKSYSTGEPSVTYTYDDPSVPNGVGRLTGTSNTRVTTTINAYNAVGEVTSTSKTIEGDGNAYTTSFAYDLAGRLNGLTYPDGYEVGYGYYPGTGLINTVTGPEGVVHATYSSYKPWAGPGQVDYGNATSTQYAYDPYSSKLMGIVTTSPSSTGDPEDDVVNRGYAYTRAGDIQTVIDYRKGSEMGLPDNRFEYAYQYDDLHRLKSEGTTNDTYQPMGYTYNEIGNMMSRVVGGSTFAYAYDAVKKHAVASITSSGETLNFAYDANGSMVTASNSGGTFSRQIAYSAENKPVHVVFTKDGVTKTSDFIYDGNGTRAKKVLQGGTTIYYVGSHFEIEDGRAIRYVLVAGVRIAKVAGAFGQYTPETYYYHKDHLGSSIAMTDAEGIVEESNYMPFGDMREHTGTEVTNYKYSSQEYDPETGLYYYRARYYDASIGRFISADSIVPEPFNPQSLNRYSYVLNNPLRYTDPTGHYSVHDLEDDIKDFLKSDLGLFLTVTIIQPNLPVTGTAMLASTETGQNILAAELVIATAVIAPHFGSIGFSVITGELQGAYAAYKAGGNILAGVVVGGAIGATTSYLAPSAGNWLSGTLGDSIYASVASGAVQGAIVGAGSGAVTGFAGGAGSLDNIIDCMLKGAKIGAVTGAVSVYEKNRLKDVEGLSKETLKNAVTSVKTEFKNLVESIKNMELKDLKVLYEKIKSLNLQKVGSWVWEKSKILEPAIVTATQYQDVTVSLIVAEELHYSKIEPKVKEYINEYLFGISF